MRDESGFTIIELLVVVAFIGILATLALANFAVFKGNALNATAASDARSLAPAADLAASQGINDSFQLDGGGGPVERELGSQFGARTSPNTLGFIEVDANSQQYRIQTRQPGGVCYTLENGVMTTSPSCP